MRSVAQTMTLQSAGRRLPEKTQHLRDLNQHNGWLLEGQIERNQQALEVLKPHQEPTLYGADGQTSVSHRGGKKISI
ncbi:flagella synthesis protein FlgN [Salmonella enterica subsp. enterica]|uniref:Flagella synthesis protein FlgN n=1 Tax=Salmonella enterica I TaxID=59201 RepID=A0A3S4F836_SALET|nr:flagella synthesis protein FlgN [Salmonella enterica subsp. enterica]